MKSLKIIQVLCNIGKIFSKIVFICCIVGASLCLVGILSLALGIETIVINGQTIGSIIENNSNMSMGTMYNTMTGTIVLASGEAVVAKFAEKYFQNELTDGTPLTLRGAKEIRRLGILQIAISLGTTIIASIIQAIFVHSLENVKETSFDNGSTIVLGIMFLVLSLVMQYASEELAKKEEKTE